VTIPILPASAGALPGSDNFVIFEFPHDFDGDVVYVATDTAQRISEDRHLCGSARTPSMQGHDPRSHGGAVIRWHARPTRIPRSTTRSTTLWPTGST
jgi:hypothetical protein